MNNNSIIEDYCNLCREYGLPSDPDDISFNRTLFFIFKEKRTGSPVTVLDNIGNPSPVADIARMLMQVMETDSGITVESYPHNRGIESTLYENPDSLSMLKASLVATLKQRVKRYGKKLILSLNQTSVIILENTDGPEDGFTPDELDAIIKGDFISYEKEDGNDIKKVQRNLNDSVKELRGRQSKKTGTYSHRPDLKGIATLVYSELKNSGLDETEKECFVADFMLMAGFFDFSEQYKKELANPYYKPKHKYDYIKGLINKE